MKITAAANAQLGLSHPQNPEWDHISFCQFAARCAARTARWPAPTPSSCARARSTGRRPAPAARARMAVLHARGVLMRQGERFSRRSIIGSQFDCRIDGETEIAGRPAITPVDFRASLDHRSAPAHAGARRSLAGGLPAGRYVAQALGLIPDLPVHDGNRESVSARDFLQPVETPGAPAWPASIAVRKHDRSAALIVARSFATHLAGSQ